MNNPERPNQPPALEETIVIPDLPPAQDPFAPDTEFGPYTIEGELGKGGMGVVYVALHRGLKRRVALKILKSGATATVEEVQRFRTEAEAAAKLNHPNIVPIFEIGEHNRFVFFSMKLVPGETLSRFNARRTSVTERDSRWIREITGLMLKVCRAVQHAHELFVLHRDLKPGNILLDEQREPHVTDFGLAKLLENNQQQTLTDMILGTPEFMSPEQAYGKSRDITTASDIFSLGAVYYNLLTGIQAFRGNTVYDTLDNVRNLTPLSPRTINPAVPRDLEVICLKCLEKETRHRYSSAGSLADELERWLEGRPIRARASNPSERLWKWTRRNPKLATAICAAVISLAAGAVASTIAWRKAATEARAKTEANARLLAANERLELQRSEDLFSSGNSSVALATIARVLRDNPSNRVAAARLVNSLDTRYFLAPVFDPVGSGVVAASFSPSGRLLVIGTNSRGSVVSFRRDATNVSKLDHGTAQVFSVATPPNNESLLFSGTGKGLRIWDTTASRQIASHLTNEPVFFVGSAIFRSQHVIAAVTPSGLTLWSNKGDLATEVPFPHHATDAMLAAVSADGNSVAIATEAGHLLVKQMDTGDWLTLSNAHENVIRSLCFSSDRRMGSASADATARVWNLTTGKPEHTIRASAPVYHVEFHPRNHILVTATRDGVVQCWRTVDGEPTGPAMKHPRAVNAARFAGDDRLITACDDGITRVWSIADGSLLAQSMASARQIIDVRLSGGLIASVADNESVHVFTIVGGLNSEPLRAESSMVKKEPAALPEPELREFAQGHRDEVTFVDVAPGGTLVATASADRTARVWERATRRPLFDPLLHDAVVNCARFGDDGTLLVTSTSSRQVRVWDARSGQPLTDWLRCNSPVAQASISPNSRYVITDQGELWPLYAVNGAVPQWLPGVAEAISGVRFTEKRLMEPAYGSPLALVRHIISTNTHAKADWFNAWIKQVLHEFPDHKEK